MKPKTDHLPQQDWFDRIFRKDFTVEDVILYVICIFLIVFFWVTFATVRRDEAENIQGISEDIVTQWEPNPWDEFEGWEDGSLNDTFLRAQIAVIAMRYQQANISTVALSTRKNLGFIVGTIVMILGCVIIIRGVRETPIDFSLELSEQAKARLAVTSPGIFVVFIGGALVLSTILTSGDRPRVVDEDIVCPLCNVAVSNTGSIVSPPASSDTDQETVSPQIERTDPWESSTSQ